MSRAAAWAYPGHNGEVVLTLPAGQPAEVGIAEAAVKGLVANAESVALHSQVLGVQDLNALVQVLRSASQRVQKGDLADLEGLLTAQAATLNAMFTSLIHRASLQDNMDYLDRFTRLALKAQAQCRATVETLALMKNPPIIARQANIASGDQQVNNGVVVSSASRAGNSDSLQSRLLEATHGERLDAATTRDAVARD